MAPKNDEKKNLGGKGSIMNLVGTSNAQWCRWRFSWFSELIIWSSDVPHRDVRALTIDRCCIVVSWRRNSYCACMFNPLYPDGIWSAVLRNFQFSFGREGVLSYLWATLLWGVSRIGNNNCGTNAKVYEKIITGVKELKKHKNCTLFNPFYPDGIWSAVLRNFYFSFGREVVPRYLWATRQWGVSRIGNNCRTNAKV